MTLRCFEVVYKGFTIKYTEVLLFTKFAGISYPNYSSHMQFIMYTSTQLKFHFRKTMNTVFIYMQIMLPPFLVIVNFVRFLLWPVIIRLCLEIIFSEMFWTWHEIFLRNPFFPAIHRYTEFMEFCAFFCDILYPLGQFV